MAATCRNVGNFFYSFLPTQGNPVPQRLHAVAAAVTAAAAWGAIPAGAGVAGAYFCGTCAWNIAAKSVASVKNAALQAIALSENLALKLSISTLLHSHPKMQTVEPKVLEALIEYLTSQGGSDLEVIPFGRLCNLKGKRGSEIVKIKINFKPNLQDLIVDGTRGESTAYTHLSDLPEVIKRQSVHFIDGGKAIVQTFPFITGDDLFTFVERENSPEKSQKAVRLALNLINLVEKIHTRRCAHRDLKTENLIYDWDTEKLYLIDGDSFIYLGDSEEAHTPRGTVGYRPLETESAIVDEQNYNAYNHDRFAVGAILYELFTGASPDNLESHISESRFMGDVDDDLRWIIKELLKDHKKPASLSTARQRLEKVSKRYF